MLGTMVEASVRHRGLVVLLGLIVVVGGVRAARTLAVDAVPDITNVQVQVLTNAPGLGPEEVERFITFPVESAMSGLPGLEEVRSITRPGLSAVTLVFEDGFDIQAARNLVDQRLPAARESIPEGWGTPELGPLSSGLGEIYQFELKPSPGCEALASGCPSPMALRTTLDWFLGYQLRNVPGVAEVNGFGGFAKTLEVRPNPNRLRALGLDVHDLAEAIRTANQSGGGGYIERGGEQKLIRVRGLLEGAEDLRRVVVQVRGDGVPIRVDDVAEVELAPLIRRGAVTRDGRGEAVVGIVMMRLGENPREVARAVDGAVRGLRSSLPGGMRIETFYDRTELVDRTLGTATVNLLEGGLLVVVVLLALLGSLRGGLLVASVIPLSMLAALIGMKIFGVSGNLMSLGALDFGIIVDGAVVMVEHALARLDRMPKGASRRATVARASREVARPVLFGVGIIMLVYLPVLALGGIEGKMFRPMALTVLFALGASVVFALTLVPALGSWVLPVRVQPESTRLMRACSKLYARCLPFALARARWMFAGAAGVVAGGIALGATLGADLVPRLEEGALAIQAVRLPSTSLEASIEATGRIERTLLERFPDEVRTVVSKTGRPEIATDPMGVETSDIFVALYPESQWKRASSREALAAGMAEVLEHEVPGQNYMFSQPIELRTNELISGSKADLAVHVYGDDLETLARFGQRLARRLDAIPGSAGAKAQALSGLPVLDIELRRDALARHGIAASEVVEVVTTVSGLEVGRFYEGRRSFPVRIRLDADLRTRVAQIAQLPVGRPAGGTVPLGQLADLRVVEGPASIGREAIQRRLTVEVNVRGRDLSGFVAAARDAARELELPAGYTLRWGGRSERLEAATRELAWAVPAALVLVFVLLQLGFGASRPAVLVYAMVPIAASGGLFGLWLRGMPLSISAAVGFIALSGIAVLNGLVLVSSARDLAASGVSTMEAAREAAQERLRPVLMTALTDALGFFPMAFSSSAGAEVQRPLATVVVAGLVTCTLATLFVLPALYARFGREAGLSSRS